MLQKEYFAYSSRIFFNLFLPFLTFFAGFFEDSNISWWRPFRGIFMKEFHHQGCVSVIYSVVDLYIYPKSFIKSPSITEKLKRLNTRRHSFNGSKDLYVNRQKTVATKSNIENMNKKTQIIQNKFQNKNKISKIFVFHFGRCQELFFLTILTF